MKTEPEVFSFEDLIRSPKRTTFWEGVRNYQARNFLRDEFKLGDLALIYHSNVEEPGLFGIAEIVREGYPDETALDRKSDYHDPKATKEKNPWVRVDVRALERFSTPVTREQMKADPKLASMMVLQKGSRLSIQPVREEDFRRIRQLGKSQKL